MAQQQIQLRQTGDQLRQTLFTALASQAHLSELYRQLPHGMEVGKTTTKRKNPEGDGDATNTQPIELVVAKTATIPIKKRKLQHHELAPIERLPTEMIQYILEQLDADDFFAAKFVSTTFYTCSKGPLGREVVDTTNIPCTTRGRVLATVEAGMPRNRMPEKLTCADCGTLKEPARIRCAYPAPEPYFRSDSLLSLGLNSLWVRRHQATTLSICTDGFSKTQFKKTLKSRVCLVCLIKKPKVPRKFTVDDTAISWCSVCNNLLLHDEMAKSIRIQILDNYMQTAKRRLPERLDIKKISGRQMCNKCCDDLMRPAKTIMASPLDMMSVFWFLDAIVFLDSNT